jgi:ribonuclease HI
MAAIKRMKKGKTLDQALPPSLKRFPLCKPKRHGYNQNHPRAELAAIAAAIIDGNSHIAADSLTSIHQIKKQLSHPNLHRHHIQGDVVQSIAKAIHHSPPSPIRYHKVKSHAGIIGNENDNAFARRPIKTNFDVADTSIKTAGPEGNPF